MNYNGTYYLWDPRHFINVGPFLQAEPGMVKVGLGQLSTALETLQMKADGMGRSRHLEIHCHGGTARLLLGTNRPGVNPDNVDWFGRALQAAIKPGGLIEIQACLVAAPAFSWDDLLTTEPRCITGYVAEYHGRLQELFRGRKWQWTQGPEVIGTGAKWSPTASEPFKPGQRFDPRPVENGLEFCRRLARAAGATVRASISKQAEEGASVSNDWTPSVSPIGNWEGPVFDFRSDGTVRCLGMAPFRSTSFGPIRMDTSFPLGVA